MCDVKFPECAECTNYCNEEVCEECENGEFFEPDDDLVLDAA